VARERHGDEAMKEMRAERSGAGGGGATRARRERETSGRSVLELLFGQPASNSLYKSRTSLEMHFFPVS